MPPDPLGILLISGTQERAHYALILATAAAAIGRPVTLFATNEGCHALLKDPSSLADFPRDAAMQSRGVAGLADLRTAAIDLGVRLIACEAGLRMAGLDPAALLPAVEVAGVVTWLEATRGGQLISL